MDILYLLIPLSALMVLAILGVFAWALHGGQFDDLEREGERIFTDADRKLDLDQEKFGAVTEESGSEQQRL